MSENKINDSSYIRDDKNITKESLPIEDKKECIIQLKKNKINNIIVQEVEKKIPKSKSKRERKKLSKSKKENAILNEEIINKETLIPPECNIVPYIPKKVCKKQKTLVIDLDETLVHSYFEKEPPYKSDISYDIEISQMKIHISTLIRPGAIQFLEDMSKLYEIVIFTASLSQYAIPLLKQIDKNKYCEHTLFREHCYSFDNNGNPGYVKDLSKLNRDLNNLIIIDNNPNCYFLNKDNGLPIKTWLNDRNDRELFIIKPYLEFMANDYITDVRPIINKVKEGKIIKYNIFDEIINDYNLKNEENKEINKDINKDINKENKNEENYSKTIDSSNIINNNNKINENSIKKSIEKNKDKENEKVIYNKNEYKLNNLIIKEDDKNNLNKKEKEKEENKINEIIEINKNNINTNNNKFIDINKEKENLKINDINIYKYKVNNSIIKKTNNIKYLNQKEKIEKNKEDKEDKNNNLSINKKNEKENILNENEDILDLFNIQHKSALFERFIQKENNNENKNDKNEIYNNNNINNNKNNINIQEEINDNNNIDININNYTNNLKDNNKKEILDNSNYNIEKKIDIKYKTIYSNRNEEIKNNNSSDKKDNNEIQTISNNYSINKKDSTIKDTILNSLDKNHKRILLKINKNKNKKLINNIRCINIFQKNAKTIGTDYVFNRHRVIKKNVNIPNNINNINNNIHLNTYKNGIFDEYELKPKGNIKFNSNEKNRENRLFTNETKNCVPIKLLNDKNDKKDNNNNIKKEYNIDSFIDKFTLKLKLKKNKENISVNKLINKVNNKYKNFNELNNRIKDNKDNKNNKNIMKRKLRIDKNKHSHYNFGICLSEYNLDDKNNNSFNANSNKESIKTNSITKDSSIKSKSKNSNDNNNFCKSKTMYNLSNKEEINQRKNSTKTVKKNSYSFIKKKYETDLYLKLEKPKSSNNNYIEKIKENNFKNITEFDNIIFSKRIKSNKKELKFNDKNNYNNTDNNKINIKNLDINTRKNLKLKLPLSKRINLYSGLENDFYNKDKIIAFMKKVSQKSKNKNDKDKNKNNIVNLQGLEQIKRLNFFKEKKRQGLSLGNVSKPPTIKIRPSYSSIE